MFKAIWNFIRTNIKEICFVIITVIALYAIFRPNPEKPTTQSQSITLPVTERVVIIQPQGEQEVIIVGDPDKVNVKPKKSK